MSDFFVANFLQVNFTPLKLVFTLLYHKMLLSKQTGNDGNIHCMVGNIHM